MIVRSAAILLAALFSIASLASAQVDTTQPATTQPAGQTAAGVSLQVAGKVPTPLNLSMDQLAAMDHVTVTVKGHNGGEVSYRGVALVTILKAAGLSFEKMAAARAAAGMCVIVTGSDGYRVLFSMGELDPQFEDRSIILADTQDGNPLDAARGPLEIVAPNEAAHARWVHQVVSLTVAQP
jgi:DMSO/TMAO reductase YedYZ molybdopterin-dependent catalytic subunit